ncbi:MAG TPA: hypothetical protein VHC97_18205 [Thermoanaerobaculia bacterium]|jgi:hypothetical protein|nr:hypothetical protein [Thermoanaerobaculia bacterium]
MRARILSLGCALALSVMAVAGAGPARAACSLPYCSEAERECKSGCPCAIFYCNPANCTSDCSCPIFCPD